MDCVEVIVAVSDSMIYIDNIYFGRMEVNAHSISSSFTYIFAFSHPAKVMHCVKCKHGVVVPTECMSATTTPCRWTTTTLCVLTTTT